MTEYWWGKSDNKISWVEITERPYEDIGKNLWVTNPKSVSRRLIDWPVKGSHVLHWHTPSREFVGVSKVADDRPRPGRYGVSDITGRGGITWRRKLISFEEFPTGVLTLENIRRQGSLIKKLHGNLFREYGHPLHFPFVPVGKGGWNDLRPRQNYLSVCPSELTDLLIDFLSEYREVNSWYDIPIIQKRSSGDRRGKKRGLSKKLLEEKYRKVNQDVVISWGKNFKIPTKSLEQSIRAHNRIQNSLGSWLKSRKLKPYTPSAGHAAKFDLAWKYRGTMFVCEVKSLNQMNEEKQLRLGFGQVLHYKQLISQSEGVEVCPVLVIERQPADFKTWQALAKSHGVKLVWRKTFNKLLS